jgi:uncharacterized membrane protein
MVHHGFGCFGFLLVLVIISFCLIRFFRFRHDRVYSRNGVDEAQTILQKRLVSGEIDEAEYQRLKDLLLK